MEHLSSISAFMEMGGYGFVIWSSYLLAALFVLGLGGHSLWQARRYRSSQSSDRQD